MPPRPLPRKHLRTLRHRWRQLVDLSFDGNLTMAATVLGMPFSTVQQYYQKGPRRISAAAVKRIDEVTGVGEWVAGRDELGGGNTASRTLMDASGLTQITSIDYRMAYIIPTFLCWRIERVVEEMGQHSSATRDERIDVIFAPIVMGIDIGLLQHWSKSGRLGYAQALDADGEEVEGVVTHVIRLEDWKGVRQVHEFCKIWEDELGISASPPKRPAARRRAT